MILTLYPTSAHAQRHNDAPFVQERERYLDHLAAAGAARSTQLGKAEKLLWIVQELDLNAASLIGPEQIRQASELWAAREQRPQGERSKFASIAKEWLRFLGRLEQPERTAQPFTDLIEDFAEYMQRERGLSPATIRIRRFHAGYFCTWYQQQGRPFHDVSLADVDAYLLLQRQQRWSRRTVATAAMILRAFFRHAEDRHWCPNGLAAAIQGPCIYTRELLPMGPSWEDVRRLIDSTSGDRPCDIRAKAILLLFAVYGLRSGEVAQLRLEDLDWEKELIAVRRPKQRRAQQYPLVREAGEAILRYLREVRPRDFASRVVPDSIRPSSPGLPVGSLRSGEEAFSEVADPESTLRSSRVAPCLCHSFACRRSFLQRDRRPPRSPQRSRHTGLRQS